MLHLPRGWSRATNARYPKCRGSRPYLSRSDPRRHSRSAQGRARNHIENPTTPAGVARATDPNYQGAHSTMELLRYPVGRQANTGPLGFRNIPRRDSGIPPTGRQTPTTQDRRAGKRSISRHVGHSGADTLARGDRREARACPDASSGQGYHSLSHREAGLLFPCPVGTACPTGRQSAPGGRAAAGRRPFPGRGA